MSDKRLEKFFLFIRLFAQTSGNLIPHSPRLYSILPYAAKDIMIPCLERAPPFVLLSEKFASMRVVQGSLWHGSRT